MTSFSTHSGPFPSADRIDRPPVRHRTDLAELLAHMRTTLDVFDVAAQEPAQIVELLKALDPNVVVTTSPSLAPDLWAKVAPLPCPRCRACARPSCVEERRAWHMACQELAHLGALLGHRAARVVVEARCVVEIVGVVFGGADDEAAIQRGDVPSRDWVEAVVRVDQRFERGGPLGGRQRPRQSRRVGRTRRAGRRWSASS